MESVLEHVAAIIGRVTAPDAPPGVTRPFPSVPTYTGPSGRARSPGSVSDEPFFKLRTGLPAMAAGRGFRRAPTTSRLTHADPDRRVILPCFHLLELANETPRDGTRMRIVARAYDDTIDPRPSRSSRDPPMLSPS